MTYHPKDMVPTALFFATKTENWYPKLSTFTERMQREQPNVKNPIDEEKIKAPEFVLSQGLRFTFDVRHPHRGLKGAYMELQTLAKGKGESAPDLHNSGIEFKTQLQELPLERDGPPQRQSSQQIQQRIDNVYANTKETLITTALTTDAYFHYTPSQILMASLHLADYPLAHLYLTSKIGTAPSSFQTKVIDTIDSSMTMLRDASGPAPVGELKQIDKKLYHCRNPEKMDLVSLNKAQKRDKTEDGVLDEKVVKKRKLERETAEKDADVFGPAITNK